MWEYWRDKKGIQAALEEQYPEVLAKDPALQHALLQIKAAEMVIDTIMKQKEIEPE